MKKLNYRAGIITIGIFAACLSCACFPITGNGNIISQEIPVSSFERIQISGYAIVNFHESREHRSVVTADSNLHKYIDVYTEGNVLKISTKTRRRYLLTQYTVDVYSPRIVGLAISGAARFKCNDPIITPEFKVTIAGAGEISGKFECDTFTADAAGAAQIALTGNSNNLNLSISGAGNFSGNDFKTSNATVQINGSGTMDIWVLENLKANISGAGKIRYREEPKIDYNGSGLARLERRS
jgi:hypothetical protein